MTFENVPVLVYPLAEVNKSVGVRLDTRGRMISANWRSRSPGGDLERIHGGHWWNSWSWAPRRGRARLGPTAQVTKSFVAWSRVRTMNVHSTRRLGARGRRKRKREKEKIKKRRPSWTHARTCTHLKAKLLKGTHRLIASHKNRLLTRGILWCYIFKLCPSFSCNV